MTHCLVTAIAVISKLAQYQITHVQDQSRNHFDALKTVFQEYNKLILDDCVTT